MEHNLQNASAPITNSGAASPIALDIANVQPVIIPGKAYMAIQFDTSFATS